MQQRKVRIPLARVNLPHLLRYLSVKCHPHALERMRERGATGDSDEINIDISPDEKIYGIKLLNAQEQLIKEEKISFTDESTGKTFVVPLNF